MNRTMKSTEILPVRFTIDTKELQEMLSCGRASAVEIGIHAEARVQIGRRVLWNVKKVQDYLNRISE